jgi:citrate synthase
MKVYYTAQEAAEELGISVASLYAYVSRGLIRSEAVGSDQRKRRYRAEDIQRLKERRPEKIVENALDFGTPIMESALTLITEENHYYRGYNASELAQTHSVEAAAALLWTGSFEPADLFQTLPDPLPERCQFLLNYPPFEAFQVLLPLAGTEDVTAYDTRPEPVIKTGVRILCWMTFTAAGIKYAPTGIAETIAAAWVNDSPKARDLISMALILCADHELNASSFTARCVASTGSTPYAVVSAGLAALQGHKHGGHTERVEALFREVGKPESAQSVLAGRLKRGESIPGFGHRLYPNGDPRAKTLLAAMPPDTLTQAVIEAAEKLTGQQPTIDTALVTLARVLNLPSGAPITLFALGRTIGWIGHALEQYQIDRMIRPRARYIGRHP